MLDLSSLTLPISAEQPCGTDIRENSSFGSLYAQIKDERFAARRIEREQSEESPKPHWQRVYELGVKILTEESKDLQVGCWLIEAAVRLYGFEGFYSTINLARVLIESSWDQLYPSIEGDETEARTAGFSGLNGDSTEGTLIFPLLETPLTQGKSVTSIATWQYQHITSQGTSDAQNTKDDLNSLNSNVLATSVRETPADFFQNLFNILQQSMSELELLDHALTERCGNESPSFNEIKKTLTTCITCLKNIAPSVAASSNEFSENSTEDNNTESSEKLNNRFSDRESAFQNLIEISNFFQRSEPHSLLPYLLRKAVRWGNMPLSDLFQEIIEDKNVLAHIYSLTGMEDMKKE
jgi:type VI secretion system protein ImpA